MLEKVSLYLKVDKIKKKKERSMHKKISLTVTILLLSLFVGCSSTAITTTPQGIPPAEKQKEGVDISLFVLRNYTDTPRAGMRSANLVEGVLSARGYRVLFHTAKEPPSPKEAQKTAKEDGSSYFLLGGVSEWRYKAGIDGEPAVSLRLALYESATGRMIWSATGSKSEWGNASLGTLAQQLLEEMIQESSEAK